MSAVAPANPIGYRPDIDGLRAVAIVLVVLGHVGVIFRGGFIGVDVFFVISGYLITSLVRKEIAQGTFSLARFWMRRVHRLMPALTVASLGAVLLGCMCLLPDELAELGRSLVAQSLLLANVFFWQTSGYFDGAASQKPLLHYWSLAVEEQFYLVFPLILLLRPRKSLAVLALASLGLTLALNHAHPDACFYLLPFRAWELLLGGGLAISEREVSPRWRPIASWLGLLGILAGSLLIHENKVVWPGWPTLIPCLATCLLIASCRPLDTPVARALSHPRMVHLGLISYSWYLWHWPLIACYNSWRIGRTPLWARLLMVLLGYFLGYLSYRFVETPLRRPRKGWGPARVLALAAVTQLALIGVGLSLNASKGWPDRFSPPFLRLADRGEPPWSRYQLTVEQARRGELFPIGDGPVRLVLWGDSHAMALIPELEKLAREQHCRILVATSSGAVPLLGYPAPDVCALGAAMPEWNRQILTHIRSLESKPAVLLAARWSYRPGPQLGPSLGATVKGLEGRRCYLLEEVPVYTFEPRKALLRASLLGQPTDSIGMTRADYSAQNEGLRAITQPLRSGGLSILDPTDCFFAGHDRALVEKDGRCLYWDDNHLSPEGSSLLQPLLLPLLRP